MFLLSLILFLLPGVGVTMLKLFIDSWLLAFCGSRLWKNFGRKDIIFDEIIMYFYFLPLPILTLFKLT